MDIKEIKYDFIKRERLFFDNARAILILLVVFGHMLQPTLVAINIYQHYT